MSSENRPPAWRLALLLAPAVSVLLVLFGGGLGYSLLQSLGWQPVIGQYRLSLDAYAQLLWSAEYAPVFWSGLVFSLWVSFASTLISSLLALSLALLIAQTTRGKRLWTFLLQFNLPIPHLVAAIGMLFLLGQSGLFSRLSTALGLTQLPADFPVLVRDSNGLGIIIAYVWKETPFIAVIVLGVLRSIQESYVSVAQNLGANHWQRLRYITLPLVWPALSSAALLVFAFTFGAYEVPAILGVRYPRPLPITALRFFTDADLNARPQAMALSMLITLVIAILIVVYLWLKDRAARYQVT